MEDLEVRAGLCIPGRELEERFVRSGGPGGQNVNKVSSKVELRWSLRRSTALSEEDRQWLLVRLGPRLTEEGELVMSSSRTRDQRRNREDARRKLAALLLAALARPKPRRRTEASAAAREQRLGEKRRRARIKLERRTRAALE